MKSARCRYNPDIIDTSVKTGLDIAGHIYEVPAAVFSQALTTALSLKDAVKKRISLNPANHNGPMHVYRLLPNGKWQRWRTIHPSKPAEWNRYVRLVAQSAPDRYRFVRANPTRKKGRRNPEDMEDVADAYESFHGEPSEETVIVERTIKEETKLWSLGPLIEVWIDTPTGFEAHITFPENDYPLLSGNIIVEGLERRSNQLYIEGGCQQVDLRKFEMDSPDWIKGRMILGTFAEPRGKRKHNITYRARKEFDDFEEIDYQHDLGEPNEDEPKSERREPPTLEFEPQNEQLYICGGQYTIKLPRIGVSPGIEN